MVYRLTFRKCKVKSTIFPVAYSIIQIIYKREYIICVYISSDAWEIAIRNPIGNKICFMFCVIRQSVLYYSMYTCEISYLQIYLRLNILSKNPPKVKLPIRLTDRFSITRLACVDFPVKNFSNSKTFSICKT